MEGNQGGLVPFWQRRQVVAARPSDLRGHRLPVDKDDVRDLWPSPCRWGAGTFEETLGGCQRSDRRLEAASAQTGLTMARILVAYGTTEGQTAKIADYIVDVIRGRGTDADAVNI